MLCSFRIGPYWLQVALMLLSSPVSYLLVIVVVVAVVAESLSSCFSPIADLGSSSIQDCTCSSTGCSAFDSC